MWFYISPVTLMPYIDSCLKPATICLSVWLVVCYSYGCVHMRVCVQLRIALLRRRSAHLGQGKGCACASVVLQTQRGNELNSWPEFLRVALQMWVEWNVFLSNTSPPSRKKRKRSHTQLEHTRKCAEEKSRRPAFKMLKLFALSL